MVAVDAGNAAVVTAAAVNATCLAVAGRAALAADGAALAAGRAALAAAQVATAARLADGLLAAVAAAGGAFDTLDFLELLAFLNS